MTTINDNVKHLYFLSNQIDDDNKEKVNELIELYKDRKIRNYKTILNLIIKLKLKKKTTIFNKSYEKLKNK